MALEWHGDRAKRELRERLARGLLAAGIHLQKEFMQRLGVPNPPPHLNSSRPGEYPRKRTGHGQSQVFVQPATVSGVLQEGKVKVGIGDSAFYLGVLALNGWKGIQNATAEVKSQLEAIVKRVARGG